jgi:lupus La protein
MKIKEKGLTGRAAVNRKDSIASRKGFNAFREMAKEKKGSSQDKNHPGGSKEKSKPEIWLEFMGNKIRVHEEDGTGVVMRDDVVFVKGGTMKFTGSGPGVKFDQVKVSFHSIRGRCRPLMLILGTL